MLKKVPHSHHARISFYVLKVCFHSLSCFGPKSSQYLYYSGLLLTLWVSFIFLFNQELMKDFLAKKDKGQLLIQRNRRLKENLLRPVILNSSVVFKGLSN